MIGPGATLPKPFASQGVPQNSHERASWGGCAAVMEPLNPTSIHNTGTTNKQEEMMRSGLLWLIGVPIPLILLLAFCTHHL